MITCTNKKDKSKFLRRPLRHLDLKETQSLFDLVQAFAHTSFQSRNGMRFRSPRMIRNGEGSLAAPLKKRSLGGRLRGGLAIQPSIWMQPLLFLYWSVLSFKKGESIGKEKDAAFAGKEIDSNPSSSFNLLFLSSFYSWVSRISVN